MGRGPLDGIRIIELAGIGPGPFCGMLLADMGADVIRLDRAGSVREVKPAGPGFESTARSRPSVGIDLKHPDGVAAVLLMVEQADALFEGNRPPRPPATTSTTSPCRGSSTPSATRATGPSPR
jgi:alpha-methylacyl-CoA racemase